jgi:hypothetical protein
VTFETDARNYLRKFRQTVADARAEGAGSVEMATRPVVHNFVEKLLQTSKPSDAELVVHHDTRAGSSKNRPDWRVEDRGSFGIYVLGDQKDLEENGALHLTDRDQFARYLELGNPVFVFDGIEFAFLDPASNDPLATAERLCLVPKPLDINADWSVLPIEPLVEARFKALMGAPGFRTWTEGDLMVQLAQRARFLSDTIKLLLDSPLGSGRDIAENSVLEELHKLREMVAVHHDPSLHDAQSCADFVAQVLSFGLFYAHTQCPRTLSSPEERRALISAFWRDDEFLTTARQLRPFRTIADLLDNELRGGSDLAIWHESTASILAHAEYIGVDGGPSDFHALFEQFLATFSPQIRFDRGAFYTPKELTGWMTSFVDELTLMHFGEHFINCADKVIDPCVGTGGFLESVITQSIPTKDQVPHLVGLEILPAPYALANYRLANVSKTTPFENRVLLFLTDTLSDSLNDPPDGSSNGFAEELSEASVWAEPPLRIVIGNPPSSIRVASHAPRTQIELLMDAFRPPLEKRTDRQNVQKALGNEAYRFLRWCADRVLSADRGVLALVLPGSFVYSVSTRFARKWLLDNFSEIWLLELDDDARTGAVTESLFQVRQGRCVLFAVHGVPGAGSRVWNADISTRTLEEKLQFLEDRAVTDAFTPFTVVGPAWRFSPIAPFPESLWAASWPLTDTFQDKGIFRQKCSGIKLAPSSLLFHTEQLQLIRRSNAIGSTPFRPYDALRRDWFVGQSRPPAEEKFTEEVRRSLVTAAADWERTIVPYLFRPFLDGYVVNDADVFQALGRAKGGGTRARPEIRAAFENEAIGLALAPGPLDLGATLTRFAAFAWNLPDNDISARGDAMVYCDRYPRPRARPGELLAVESNVSRECATLFDFSDDPDRAVVFYTYAVLSSSVYLDVFESVLYTSASPDDPPRIPITSNLNLRRQLVDLGRQIAECERGDGPAATVGELLLNWPDGLSEFQLKDFQFDESKSSLVLRGVNGEAVSVSGVDMDIVSLRIAGHDVVAKWLRERSFPYLRRTFKEADLQSLAGLISHIARQLTLIERADHLVEAILDSEQLIHVPLAL